jgi:hypothetical protein
MSTNEEIKKVSLGNTMEENMNQEMCVKKKKAAANAAAVPPRKKRVITTTAKWKSVEQADNTELSILREMVLENEGAEPPLHKMIRQQIKQKIYGYQCQDNLKNRFTECNIIDVDIVLQKMLECNLLCYYCKKTVHVLYEYVRESKQWTLERLDNNLGHTKENIVVACLYCNLRRRTMYHERYLFTKELNIKKV